MAVVTAVRFHEIWPHIHERFVQPVLDQCLPSVDDDEDYIVQLEVENRRLRELIRGLRRALARAQPPVEMVEAGDGWSFDRDD